MTFEDFKTIGEFLEENEKALTAFLDGDNGKAAVLINDFQNFAFDAETADNLLWEPKDDDNDE